MVRRQQPWPAAWLGAKTPPPLQYSRGGGFRCTLGAYLRMTGRCSFLADLAVICLLTTTLLPYASVASRRTV